MRCNSLMRAPVNDQVSALWLLAAELICQYKNTYMTYTRRYGTVRNCYATCTRQYVTVCNCYSTYRRGYTTVCNCYTTCTRRHRTICNCYSKFMRRRISAVYLYVSYFPVISFVLFNIIVWAIVIFHLSCFFVFCHLSRRLCWSDAFQLFYCLMMNREFVYSSARSSTYSRRNFCPDILLFSVNGFSRHSRIQRRGICYCINFVYASVLFMILFSTLQVQSVPLLPRTILCRNV